MLVPTVSAELMTLARAVAVRPGRVDVINTMIKENPGMDFDDIYAAVQRLFAFTYTLAQTDAFDQWIMPPCPGEPYCEISPAIWGAVATARLERDEYDLYTKARFDLEELRRAIANSGHRDCHPLYN